MTPRKDPLALQVELRPAGQATPPELAVYAYTHQGEALAAAPVFKGSAQLLLPAQAEGRTVDLVLGPPLQADGTLPDKAALLRAGALRNTVRELNDRPVRIPLTPDTLTQFCICRVRGRVVKRVPAPGGGTVERPVCDTRVHVLEVDRIPLVIERLPERDLLRLRDDLLERLKEVPVPFPDPRPGPDPAPRLLRAAAPAAAAAPARRAAAAALQTAHSAEHLRTSLKTLAPDLLLHLCDLRWLHGFLHADEVLVLPGGAEGRFGGWLFHRCHDQPDLYFWVEQFRHGAWSTVYRPGLGCGTHWNYVCGTEVVIDAPAAEACEETGYDLPDGVTLFVTPWAVGEMGIWGQAAGAPAGRLRGDGMVDYVAGGLGLLHDAPFGGTLHFHHDDSWFIPSPSTPVTHYRYAVRRRLPAPNTGADDGTWAPLLTPQSRSYRLEYSDRLPTYQSIGVGPETLGGRQGLFRFRPPQPPHPGGTVVASEWLLGNPSEIAATWDTTVMAPAMSDTVDPDQAGDFEVKIEVFDATGTQVMPGPSTFRFLLLDAAGTGSRFAESGEVQGGAFVMRVKVDNNRCRADLPMPDIRGAGPNPNCGFLHYTAADDPVRLRYEAGHPNDRAVFTFGVVRGATGVPVATTAGPYVETASAAAPTTGAQYDRGPDGLYAHAFRADELLSPCLSAAFAASLSVHAKATDGRQRLGAGLDAHRLIAFALAASGS